MKIVQINTFSNKSTGTIMMNIHNKLKNEEIESYVVWGRGRKVQNSTEIYMDDKIGVYKHALYTRLMDKTGFYSKNATKKLIKKLENINPDIIHLHNLHGYYINIEMLFDYIRKNNIKVVWTLHDCWAFTGHCSHFELIGCDKWENCCYHCIQKNVYPKSIYDNSKWNYHKKKELFTGLDMVIVTPSEWLANLVKKSFLKEYKVIVINNGINMDVFKPRQSDFKKKFNIEDKKIILGVASDWTKEKGFYDFINLASIINETIKIVLVGLNNKQLKQIPNNIIGIQRTENAKKLAEIYSAADVYFNPTYADNYPTTNLEALACGTPVITYNTGGSSECINGKNGIVTTFDDFCKNYQKYLNQKYSTFTEKINNIDNMNFQYLNLYKMHRRKQ